MTLPLNQLLSSLFNDARMCLCVEEDVSDMHDAPQLLNTILIAYLDSWDQDHGVQHKY